MEGDLQCVLNKLNTVEKNINNLTDNIRESSTTSASLASNIQQVVEKICQPSNTNKM